MSTALKVLLIILVILVVALIVLYFVGKRLQKRQNEQQEQMEAAKQTVSMLVIDKKIMPIKESGLPQIVIDQTPKMMRRSKLPIVKAKVGPRIMTLVADSKVFDLIPVKKEVKAVVSGIYIMQVHGVRGALQKDETPKKRGLPGVVPFTAISLNTKRCALCFQVRDYNIAQFYRLRAHPCRITADYRELRDRKTGVFLIFTANPISVCTIQSSLVHSPQTKPLPASSWKSGASFLSVCAVILWQYLHFHQ